MEWKQHDKMDFQNKERLVNNKCVLKDSKMSLREHIQQEIDKSKNCPSDILTKIKF